MCRFLAYAGQRALCVADLVKKPRNSLINQSRTIRGERRRLNADGFGLGWYNPPLGPEPAVYRSIQPAWNNRNLDHFIEKTAASLFIAHIRASTVGLVGQVNCHPFNYGPYLFAHNGTLFHFDQLKRALLQQLPEHLFLSIEGTTDSECLFYLILSFLERPYSTLEGAVCQAIDWVRFQQEALGAEHYSCLNMVITDGESVVASRVSTKERGCYSLFVGRHPLTGGVIISSEIIGFHKRHWQEIPPQSVLTLNRQEEVWHLRPYENS